VTDTRWKSALLEDFGTIDRLSSAVRWMLFFYEFPLPEIPAELPFLPFRSHGLQHIFTESTFVGAPRSRSLFFLHPIVGSSDMA